MESNSHRTGPESSNKKSLLAFLLKLEKKMNFEICLLCNAGEILRQAKDRFPHAR